MSVYKRTSAALFIFIPTFCQISQNQKQKPSMATKCQGFKKIILLFVNNQLIRSHMTSQYQVTGYLNSELFL